MATHTTLTVAELVDLLQKLPQNLPVFASDGSEYANGVLLHSGVAVVATDLGDVVFVGNGDGELAVAK